MFIEGQAGRQSFKLRRSGMRTIATQYERVALTELENIFRSFTINMLLLRSSGRLRRLFNSRHYKMCGLNAQPSFSCTNPPAPALHSGFNGDGFTVQRNRGAHMPRQRINAV